MRIPEGDPYDVIELAAGGLNPDAKVCGRHGEPYYKECPNADCPHQTYHPSDSYENFHKPCGEKIPWADARNGSVIVGLGYQSQLLREVARVRELTAAEQQDLIMPPSGRLPADRVRPPKSRQIQGQDEMPHAERWQKTTWNDLEQGRVVRVEPPPPPLLKRIGAGLWEFLFGSLQNTAGTIVAAVVILFVAAYCGVKLAQ